MGERKIFQYRNWPGGLTSSQIRLDFALDRIGEKIHNEKWGRQKEFHLLPLFYSEKNRKLTTIEIHKINSYTRKEIVVTDERIDLAADFKQVYRLLRSAITSGKLPAHINQLSYRPHRLRGHLMKRRTYKMIFGTGTVKIGDDRSPIGIKKETFAKWLNTEFTPVIELSAIEMAIISREIRNRINDGVLRNVSRVQLEDFIMQWKSAKVLDIEDLFWSVYENGRAGGRPIAPRKWDLVVKGIIVAVDAKLQSISENKSTKA